MARLDVVSVILRKLYSIFFLCHAAKFVWNSLFYTFGLQPLSTISELLGSWLEGFPHKFRKQVLVGAVALWGY